MKLNRDETLVMVALIATVVALAAAMVWKELATYLEAVSFVTGALGVWLTVKENAWNFPIGLANVATFSVVFYRSHLFADAGLQVVYFVLIAIGWYMWLFGGRDHSPLRITRAPSHELTALAVLTAAVTVGLWQTLSYAGGSASFWDALTASLSLASQWLLNRKRLESWIGWIVVDTIYVPLYMYKELYLTAILYFVFIIMAVIGLRKWRESWLANDRTAELTPGAGTL